MAKSKGFKFGKPKETVTIRFAEDHACYGLEIVVQKRVPIGVILGAQAGDFARTIEPFIKRIVSWNLTDEDDNPVPVSRAAFDEEFDSEAGAAVLYGWIEAVTGAGAPLDEPSPDESTSEPG